jgi:serine/threonine protein kinase
MGEMPEKIGPYRLLDRLGEGGMAETFVALKHGPGGFVQRVCVKRIRQGLAADPDYVRQFLAEARLAATLRHANLAQVIDFGQDGDAYWLALELIEGMDLRALLGACGGRLPAELVAHLGAELASALDVAHRTGAGAAGAGGIVHRDVSPSNVLLSLEGEVKLTDFGIARRLDEPSHTRTGVIRGKIPYLAPEYVESGHYGPRSDLFALGVIMYEALSGQRPHDGPADFETLRRATRGEHPALAALCPEAPAALCALIERLLEPDPLGRPPSAAALLDALAPLALGSTDARRELAKRVRMHRAARPTSDQPQPPAPQPEPSATEVLPVDAAPDAATRSAPKLNARPGGVRRAPSRTGPVVATVVVALPLLVAGAIWVVGHDIRPAGHAPPASTAPEARPVADGPPLHPDPSRPLVNDGEPGPGARDPAGSATGTGAAQLTVIVLPFGTASVDGSEARATPLKLDLPAGSHLIQAQGHGRHFERSLQLEPNEKKRVVFE